MQDLSRPLTAPPLGRLFRPEQAGLGFNVLFSPQDDGAIRVWKNFADLEKNPEMVTAWQGLSDMLPTTRGGSPQGQRRSLSYGGPPSMSPRGGSTGHLHIRQVINHPASSKHHEVLLPRGWALQEGAQLAPALPEQAPGHGAPAPGPLPWLEAHVAQRSCPACRPGPALFVPRSVPL